MENIIRCPNGHFYDAAQNRTCPYCQQGSVEPTDRDGGGGFTPPAPTERTPSDPLENPPVDSIGATLSAYADYGPIQPVTGWLVCVEGAQKGQDFRICVGRNFIGRDIHMDICLSDDMRVSRNRHAIIIFDPASQTTFCQAGESRGLFYLNGKVVTDTMELHQGDSLKLGDTRLVFVPFCGAVHTWEETEV